MEKQTKFLTRKQAAALLESHGYPWTTVRTLANFACRGDGPPFRKCGRHSLYESEAVLTWAEAKVGPELRSTSDQRAAAAE